MRFHILGLVHLPCTKEYISCAFTQKNYKLCEMLLSLGHEVFYYGAEGSTVPCTEFIQTHTLNDIRDEWGDGDNRFEIGYDWKSADGYRHDFTTATLTTQKYIAICIEEINKRKRPDDFLDATMGLYHKPIADEVGLYLTIESGIGYFGSYCNFRAFESAFMESYTYGAENGKNCPDGKFYDRIIPNYFVDSEFEFSEEKEDYYLYIGRILLRKGLVIAAQTCDAAGVKLKIAGTGGIVTPEGWLTNESGDFKIPPGTWEYVGMADIEKRKALLKNAIATLVPTQYLEPFAGTHIESMLSGTPVITTTFGVFAGNTYESGVHGFKCNTLQDFVDAIEKVKDLDNKAIRKHAEQYLTDNVKMQYEKWFQELYSVYLSTINPDEGYGWPALNNKTTTKGVQYERIY